MVVHELEGYSLYEQWLLDDLPIHAMPYEWRLPINYWVTRRRPTQELYWDEPWTYRMLLAGRGAGKSFAMAEMAMDAIQYHGVRKIAVVGRTGDEVEDTIVKDALVPAAIRRFGERNVKLVLGKNPKLHLFGGVDKKGVTFFIKSSQRADSFRGYNLDLVLADEWCFWKDIEKDDNAWENLKKATRLGSARFIIATTPIGREFVREMRDREDVFATTCSSFENRAYLSDNFYEEAMVVKKTNPLRYREEYLGEVVEEIAGAMWTGEMIKAAGWYNKKLPELYQVVVSIDPAGSAGDKSDHTGIVVLGRDINDHGYVLHAERVKLGIKEWLEKACKLAEKYKATDFLIETTGAGSDALKEALLDASKTMDRDIRVHATTPSGRGSKWERATPVSMLYNPDDTRMHHVGETSNLEKEMRYFTPEASMNKAGDDLVDSLTQGASFLKITKEKIDWSEWEF